MNALRPVFSLIFSFLFLVVHAQTGNFELDNPHSLLLDNSSLDILTSGYWRVFKDEMESGGKTASSPKNISMCYFADGTLFYNGSTGTWEIVEGRYIQHKLKKEDQERLNFGGIFSVTEISDSTLALTKVLTTSHDMKRTLYLKSSTILTKTEQPNSGGPYFYDGTLDALAMDSLSNMEPDELFDAGFTILGNNMVHIMTPDTLYVIRLKSNKHSKHPIRP